MNHNIASLTFLLLVTLTEGCSTQASAPADSSLLPKAVVDQFYAETALEMVTTSFTNHKLTV